MARIKDASVEQVKNAIDIVALVESYTRLRKSCLAEAVDLVRVVGEHGGKIQRAARRRRLKDRKFLGSNLRPEFPRMLSVHPGQIVRKTEGVLNFMRWQERWASDLRNVAERDLW